ncbi:hypothetical protein J437_LFUL004088 [Ladona fulva]|uniref:Cadherin domain-containing protein n=1 Tax=Ladona fulva TaxID=123851 RepID=A0A8K0K207_LADFU|nr:hypothetical protein J437_LFUL004088 [Ladona fulva]
MSWGTKMLRTMRRWCFVSPHGIFASLLVLSLLLAAEGRGPGPGQGGKRQRSPMTGPALIQVPPPMSPRGSSEDQMQSRAVDTRVTLEVLEGRPKGTRVGFIPTKPGFTYRFNEPPKEFLLNATSGEVTTAAVLDREALRSDRYDLVVLSSQPTYPIEVRIIVGDVNDNAPEFPEPSIAVAFSESASAGTRLLLDTATDRDTGVNGMSDDYRIESGNVDDKFRLMVTANPSGDTSYLHLETTGQLDREARATYRLNVSARDGGTPMKLGFLLVNVTILDVNDNPPIFDHSDYIVSLNESVLPGTPVLQVMATDSDAGDNAKITYYLSDTETQFSVDPETGTISTMETLSCPQNCPQQQQQQQIQQQVSGGFESSGIGSSGGSCPKSCVFTVFARDHGSPRQDGRTYVTVNLVDANDHDPIIRFRYFPATAAFATVDENAFNGTVVAAVSVIDFDEGPNGKTSVEIRAGNELGHFRLEAKTSFDIVRVNDVLDREQLNKYNLTVVATDEGSPPRSATAFLVIHVNDINDHEPVFEKSEYSAVLSESAPVGTFVAAIHATDEDSGVNSHIYYAIEAGDDQGWFDIDGASGLVTTKASLDREVRGTVELRISARDGGPNPKWARATLKVTVLDENDERPGFAMPSVRVRLSESTPPGTLVASLTAADHDQGTNGSVTYGLHSDVAQRYPGLFALDAVTGQLTTRTKLDRESIAEYEIRVIARDQGIPPQSSTATVMLFVEDENDNSPEFYPQEYFVAIPEDSPAGTTLLTITATDDDEGENAQVEYSIEGDGGDGIFRLGARNGALILTAPLSSSPKPLFRLRIAAKDRGDRRAVEDATVEIVKASRLERIQFESAESGYKFKIREDHAKREPSLGREVGRVRVAGGRSFRDGVRYSIALGDPKRAFRIDERTGIITTGNRIDREAAATYHLTAVARAGLAYGSVSVHVSVLDENDCPPVFPRDRDEVRLNENAPVGQEVYLAKAVDPDAGENAQVTYGLASNPEGQFRISPKTGVIYLNKPIRSEPGTTLSLEVVATDNGKPSLSSRHSVIVTIEDVNDHTPVFDHTSYETSLLESAQVNARFFALSATDTDLGENGRIAFDIAEGNADGKFGVFPDGFLYVRSPLDREERDYYALVVRAHDHGSPPRSSHVPVVVHVIDENDNAPEFFNATFNFYVRENEPPDTFVGKLTASDMDIGRNAELTFSLAGGGTGGVADDFAIDPHNGFLKTLRRFDRENLVSLGTGQSVLSLEAIVTDNGSPRLRDRAKVNVFVTDVNDNAPRFLRTPYRVQISEVASVGTQVLRLYATDADEGLNGDVFYAFVSGNDARRFGVDEATGQISLAGSLDREVTPKYVLTVAAYDAGETASLSVTTTVTIDVLDENDNAPEFTQTTTHVSVSEKTAVGTLLVQFRATDADLGLNSEVTFSIAAGNRKDTFRMDSATGELYLHKSLDYEELREYKLNITASDGGNPSLSTTVPFGVSVEDDNDNPPAFPTTAIVRQIQEGIPVRTPIVTVTAEDPDSGDNGRVTYAIARQEPPGHHFGIGTTTGVVHTLLPIDREAVDTFRLTVVATDKGSSVRLSAEKLVTVIVEDVNDNAPTFVSMSAAVLPRPAARDAFVMQVHARDLDSSTNGLVTYELVGGNSDLFELHRSTGELRLRRSLPDPPEETRYRLTVKATDEAVQAERKSMDAYVTVIATAPSNGGGLGGMGNVGPVFEGGEARLGSVYENEPIGTSIVTVGARLPGNSLAEVEYYVTNVTVATVSRSTGDGINSLHSMQQVDRLFDIDTKLGVISTAVVLDREGGADAYDVEVYAVVVSSLTPQTMATRPVIRRGATEARIKKPRQEQVLRALLSGSTTQDSKRGPVAVCN